MGIISLEDCQVAQADESLRRPNALVITTRSVNYFLEASDLFEMAGWMEAIHFHSRNAEAFEVCYFRTNPEIYLFLLAKKGPIDFRKMELFNHITMLLSRHESLKNYA